MVARSAVRVWIVGFVIGGAPLEAQRETRGEVADVRSGEEVGRAEVRLRSGVDLGIETTVVGPGVQVAAGEGEHGRPCARASGEAWGERERQRYFAELGERRVLDEAAVESEGGGLRRCLLLEVARVG